VSYTPMQKMQVLSHNPILEKPMQKYQLAFLLFRYAYSNSNYTKKTEGPKRGLPVNVESFVLFGLKKHNANLEQKASAVPLF